MKKKFVLFFILSLSLFPCSFLKGQNVIPANRVINIDSLQYFLKKNVRNILEKDGKISEADLAEYFKKKFSERYYYNWQTVPKRFRGYVQLYHQKGSIEKNAAGFMGKFPASAHWILPFNYLNGGKVDVYHFRHFVRQKKMLDVAFQYFLSNNNPKYINYFVKQMKSLNTALETGKYAKIKNGNGVYEDFRAGKRIFYWLTVHNMFLGQKAYTNRDQLTTIATLLQHAEFLYEHNTKFRPGNHQTKGMSALAVISILLRDFKGTNLWYNRAMSLLQDHLLKEVNKDGFQSERSIHYQMVDITNYFYVYQLAKKNGITENKILGEKLFSMFTALAKLAFPDKTGPVLQDDTDNPWAERTNISGTMALGYVLFRNPVFGYFAAKNVSPDFYWFLSGNQLSELSNIHQKEPPYRSLEFPETKYYVMRQGWKPGDQMMVISAGLNKRKPDHQQGDMLGIQAVANGHVILPNYEVRYSLPDYELFKNSLVKNVALINHQLQGRDYVSNPGKSGFGKFLNLPVPSTILWQTNKNFDIFIGSHNGFNNLGVNYYRQVIYVRNNFWIVKDNFLSKTPHNYKQVWQGHYTKEKYPNLLQSSFSDGSGCNILELHKVSDVYCSGVRGKQWTIDEKKGASTFSFVTVIYPFKGYLQSISVASQGNTPDINGWLVDKLDFGADGKDLKSISKNNTSYLFGVKDIKIKNLRVMFANKTDLFLQKLNGGEVVIRALGFQKVEVKVTGAKTIYLNDQKSSTNEINLFPGGELKCLE